MKIFIVFTFVLSSTLLFPINLQDSNTTDVYICTGKSSKKYHYKKNCRGLSNCKADIKKVTLEEAKKYKRTLCGWED